MGVGKAKSLILRAYRGEKSKFCYTQKKGYIFDIFQIYFVTLWRKFLFH